MLLNVDLKGTEWVAINWFSQDPVGCKELLEGLDQHSLNQKTFGLPDRVTAKVFVFRLIYGGTSYSYVYDPDFNWISKQPKFWQKIIDSFYEKYKGIQAQHQAWMSEAISTGRLVMPTGRVYQFAPQTSYSGGFKWPRTKILNYPVQGLGHDLTTIARVSLYKRIKKINEFIGLVKFISTVHDSVILDFPDSLVNSIRSVVEGVAIDLPNNFYKLFGMEFNLPIKVELTVGKNMLDMQPIL